jgi:hypothetical protein
MRKTAGLSHHADSEMNSLAGLLFSLKGEK